MARINLRMPDHLKSRIDRAAAGQGLSVNAWLVRAAAAALEHTRPFWRARPARPAGRTAIHRLGSLSDCPLFSCAATDIRHRSPERTSMPTFDTPDPISVIVELGVGDLQIAASDRANTVVEVEPSDSAKPSDVAAAAKTTVEYANGVLRIKAPKGWRRYSFRGGTESIDVRIQLPTGSRLHGEAGLADLRCSGVLGECQYKTGVRRYHH